jgi:hypothetical protein
LKSLADAGLGAASVLANLHHRRIVPLMERELRVYEMSEAANLTSLARSRFLPERLPQEYAATRARRAISLKAVRHSNDDLWSFVMLPDAPAVSSPPFLHSLATRRRDSDVSLFLAEGGCGRRTVRPAHALSPHARAQRSGRSKSGRRARRSGGSGGGSAGNSEMRSTSCASSKDFLPRRPRSTRRREREKGKRATGGRPPWEVGACAPHTKSRGGGRGTSAWGGHGSARHQAVYERGGARREGADMHHRGVRECCSGNTDCHHSVRRALEEEEARLLHLEVSSRFSRCSGFEGLELKLLSPY